MHWITCTSCEKRGYLRRTQARAAIRALRQSRQEKEHSDPMRSYRCERSGLWHIGHQWAGPSLNDPNLRWTS